jgi:4-hydroxybenzoyl-CoA thioesterase
MVILAVRVVVHNSIPSVVTTIIFTFKSHEFPSRVEKRSGEVAGVSKKGNITNRKTIHIEWGDCDPAKIVHYPRYLAYFDACTTALFKKAGLPIRELFAKYRIVGIPMVELRVSFTAPSRVSDVVVVESVITEWGRSSFCVRHKLFNRNILAVECIETRVWAAVSGADPEKIVSRPVPQEVIEKFSAKNNVSKARQSPRRTPR